MEKKQLKDYIHLYLGCEAIHDVLGLEKVTVSWLADIDNFCGDIDIEYEGIKLILRPLDSMTFRDASDIVSALPGMVVSDCYSFLQDWINSKSIMITFETNVALTNEMRKLGFDVDNLIPAGLAVKANYKH